ncbi:MAG: (Fe-S)-binding protein [Bacteroidales bacterium]
MPGELFTYPFLIGITALLIIIVHRFGKWFSGLSKFDKIRVWKNIRTRSTWKSFLEAFTEGLLHHKIFRKSPVLGYMHMSLAFGWFLLIVVGHIETVYYYGSFSFPLYMPVFFRFFVSGHEFYLSRLFAFVMDLILLMVLSGVSLAYLKRAYKKMFGMKKTTLLRPGDQIAMTALWCIFPLRFLAESISAGIHHNGSFLTQLTGNILQRIFPVEYLNVPVWFAYSTALGFFFVALPFSRYMHIPTEIFYIFLKNSGIKLKKRVNSYSQVQVYSCSRCGICLDSCQLNDAGIRNTQSVYVLKKIRDKKLTDEVLFNCLLCGKCQHDCPVDIELNNLRITQRIESTLQYNASYGYLRETRAQASDIVYFAGCMTHLTPSIKKSMIQIFDYAKLNYWFMDEDKAPCCGRPLIQAGQFDAAQKLILNNQKKILDSGASTLVVSCPICYKVFNEDYVLPGIKVLHHSELINNLVKENKLILSPINETIIYHDPCELGRGSGIYEQPRELLEQAGTLIKMKNEKEKSFCCGGSLANIKITMNERDRIAGIALETYKKYKANILATSCPLCKKTFVKNSDTEVKDIAEIVWKSVQKYEEEKARIEKHRLNMKKAIETWELEIV